MTMLVPGALAGLALLAIPVLVHLFRPRKVRQTPFSSLRWLHLTQQRMARRIQWHQVLLFLLRAAFITLLVLALTRPLISPDGPAGLDRVLVIDVSPSMGRQMAGRPRPIDAAREMAARLLAAQQPADRAAVLLAGSATTVLVPWTTDLATFRPAIEAVEPGLAGANLDAAFAPLRILLQMRRPDAATEVCFLTDRAAGSWTPGAIAAFLRDLPDGARPSFRLVDVGLPGPRNGWLSAARLRETQSGPALRIEGACVGESSQQRTLHVAGLNGVEELSIPIMLVPNQATIVDLPLPASFAAEGSRARIWLAPPDELEVDDRLFVDLDSRGGPQVLLIEAETAADPSQRPGFPLRTALTALAESGAAAADAHVRVRTPAGVAAADFAEADLILLADIPGLTETQAADLTRRVQAGAGVAMFLGPAAQLDVYNDRFTSPLHPDQGLLPARLAGVAQATAAEGSLAPWRHWHARHPLLAGMLDPLLGDLAATRSRAYIRLDGPLGRTDEVLAAFDDGTPALLDRRVGAGRVLLVNASADDRWCDLPRRKAFVALVDRLLGYLAPAGTRRNFAGGEPVVLPLPAGQTNGWSVRSPSGAALTPRIEASPGATWLRLDPPGEAGFYSVVPPASATAGGALDGPGTFVVQADRGDSPLAQVEPDTLRAWWQPASLELLKPADIRVAAATGRFSLEPWLVLAAALVLMTEMFLVHWLCPRVNPAVAAAPPRRRGSVAPLRGRQGAQA
jgi:hypothetical protein